MLRRLWNHRSFNKPSFSSISKLNFHPISWLSSSANAAANTTDANTINQSEISENVHEDGMNNLPEEEIENLRNVSRMPKRYRDRMLHVLNPDPSEVNPDYITAMYQKPALKKLLYAWYGKKSGINPGILWPSEGELKEIIEFEKEWEPSLQDMIAKLKEEKELEIKEIKEKEKLIESRLAKMPQYIREYRARLKKAEEQEIQLKKKRQILLDEARDYFGYQIDPNDPRFEQIKLAKEEEEKKMMKKKKKEEKLSNVAKFTAGPTQ